MGSGDFMAPVGWGQTQLFSSLSVISDQILSFLLNVYFWSLLLFPLWQWSEQYFIIVKIPLFLTCEHQLPANQEQNLGKYNSSVDRAHYCHFLLRLQGSSSSSDSSSSDSEEERKKKRKDKKKKKKKVDWKKMNLLLQFFHCQSRVTVIQGCLNPRADTVVEHHWTTPPLGRSPLTCFY